MKRIIPYILLFTVGLITGNCGHKDQYKGSSDNLFPIYGVTPGRTTLAKMDSIAIHSVSIDEETGEPFNYYRINELDFWYNPNEKIINRVTLVKPNPMPKKWWDIGFSWEKSYSEYLVLFKKLKCPISFTNNPKVVDFNGHDSFEADLTAYKEESVPLEIYLRFAFNSGSSKEDQNTLYSIRVKYNN